MPAPKLKIIRVPLSESIPDIKPQFADLGDLHLELLENKLKLKKGLPLIPIRKKGTSPVRLPDKPQPKIVSKNRPVPSPSRRSSIPEGRPAPRPVKKTNADDELVQALGVSDGEGPAKTKSGMTSNTKKGTEIEFIDEELQAGPVAPKVPEVTVPSESLPEDVPPTEADGAPVEEIPAQPETPSEPAPEGPPEEAPAEEPVEEEPQKSAEEIEEEERQEFVVKLRILKKQYPKYEFPPYSPDHTDAATLKRIYRQAYRELTLDENVEKYEMWMGAAFIVIGMLGVKLNLPFHDFAKIQMKKMKKYRRLLFELGEKSYMTFMDNWPVEVRLLGLIVMDTALFWLGKVGLDFLGSGAGDLLSMLTGTSSEDKSEKKARMRGPRTKPEDIKGMASKDD